jgi:hypothetical protein
VNTVFRWPWVAFCTYHVLFGHSNNIKVITSTVSRGCSVDITDERDL